MFIDLHFSPLLTFNQCKLYLSQLSADTLCMFCLWHWQAWFEWWVQGWINQSWINQDFIQLAINWFKTKIILAIFSTLDCLWPVEEQLRYKQKNDEWFGDKTQFPCCFDLLIIRTELCRTERYREKCLLVTLGCIKVGPFSTRRKSVIAKSVNFINACFSRVFLGSKQICFKSWKWVYFFERNC